MYKVYRLGTIIFEIKVTLTKGFWEYIYIYNIYIYIYIYIYINEIVLVCEIQKSAQ